MSNEPYYHIGATMLKGAIIANVPKCLTLYTYAQNPLSKFGWKEHLPAKIANGGQR
jgi:hypothetical protein